MWLCRSIRFHILTSEDDDAEDDDHDDDDDDDYDDDHDDDDDHDNGYSCGNHDCSKLEARD